MSYHKRREGPRPTPGRDPLLEKQRTDKLTVQTQADIDAAKQQIQAGDTSYTGAINSVSKERS